MGRITNIYALTALASIGGLLFGFDVSSMSAIITTPNYLVFFGSPSATVPCATRPGALCNPGPSAGLQGIITASMSAGALVSSLLSGLVADHFGRRPAIFLGCILWIIGSLLLCTVQNVVILIIGRVLGGACVGLCSAQVPVYLSELAPPRLRGRLIGCVQWGIAWGICGFWCISVAAGFIGNRIDGEQDGRSTMSFRLPWGLRLVPATVLMVLVPMMPESPRYLIAKGRNDEALGILAKVHAKGDTSSASVQKEYHEIVRDIEESQADGSGYVDLFRGGNLWRTHIALFVQIWSSLTGLNIMTFYMTYVCQMAGLLGTSALVLTGFQYVVLVIMTIPAMLWVDRLGRRPLLLIGSTIMAICLFSIAALMSTRGHPWPDSPNAVVSWKVDGLASHIILFFSYLFVAAFAPTWGPVSWIYVPELIGNRLRSKAGSLATAAGWMFNFALGYAVPPAFHNVRWKTYVIFGCFCVAMTVHVALVFPETAGRSLEEVEEIFASGVPAWRTRARSTRIVDVGGDATRGSDEDKLDSSVI
ncbi:General substrate transporter [Kalmanozyma brasiliensis GHG001]|uniref:Major facilitator superfamily (MFS) profile domain-containing protein n=1 Tax=Kalmanozyma brasiliensis (strain GHG001) TaxID=1365824 RepID=V5EX47_KALBG|nr:General substrate transporter [Kalmanozyma brasiliensis GHG001]EST07988.1 General substrate transporter [Kalmanozyma brasiliensis GHG001]